MRRVLAFWTSVRTTLVVLVLLAELLALRIVLPQVELADAAAMAELTRNGPLARFFLVTLGLAHIPTSPVFIALLAVFFVNLAAVLASRSAAIVRRMDPRAMTAGKLAGWLDKPGAISRPRPSSFGAEQAGRVLRELGFRVMPVGVDGLWAIKNARSVFGFVVFHASFFVFALAGALIYYTRHVELAALVEGQRWSDGQAKVVRESPLGPPSLPDFVLARVEPELVSGEPSQLTATLAYADRADGPVATGQVNAPAEWYGASVLVDRAGVAPVVWLLDGRGAVVDKVAVVAPRRGEGAPAAPLLDGELTLSVQPVGLRGDFPMRARLGEVRMQVLVSAGAAPLFSGELGVGETREVGAYHLRIDELRYWAQLRVVYERGGWLLILAFGLAVVGLVWRLLWGRQEVGLVWREDRIDIAGRAEYDPGRFVEELEAIAELLVEEGRAPTSERTAG